MSENIGEISEAKFQKKVIATVSKQYGFVFENKGSAIQRRGIPDLQIHLPWMEIFDERDLIYKDGELDSPVETNLVPGGMVWLELKVQDGRVGASQRKMMRSIRDSGGLAMISMLMKDGVIKTWEIDKKEERVFNSFLRTSHFETGLWLRQILSVYASEAPPKKRSIKRVPLSFAKVFLDTSPDA